MQASEVPRAVAAAMSIGSSLGLPVDDAIVLHHSNKLAVRLLPCDSFARVAHVDHHVGQFEVELAQRLAEIESPVAALEPRVEPRVYEHDGFAVTLWTYYELRSPREVTPADYANVLARLHAGMRKLDVTTPHFTDRVAEAEELVVSRDRTPALADADRELLSTTLRTRTRAIRDRGAGEQLLHGEPHPGNLLSTNNGLRFIDLETCCTGPIEFDLAHVPEAVSDRYPDADPELLRDCRVLVLAMVAAWRWDPTDQLPNGRQAAHDLVRRAAPGSTVADTRRRDASAIWCVGRQAARERRPRLRPDRRIGRAGGLTDHVCATGDAFVPIHGPRGCAVVSAVGRQIGPGVARLGVGQGLLVPVRVARSGEAEHRPLPGDARSTISNQSGRVARSAQATLPVSAGAPHEDRSRQKRKAG